MSEGFRLWAEEVGNARYDEGCGEGVDIGSQRTRGIFAELIAGTSKKNVCKKLGVKMRDVDAAYQILHAK